MQFRLRGEGGGPSRKSIFEEMAHNDRSRWERPGAGGKKKAFILPEGLR